MDKQLLRNIICQDVQKYQVAFLRRLADNLENGYINDKESDHWSEFVGTIADDIEHVFD